MTRVRRTIPIPAATVSSFALVMAGCGVNLPPDWVTNREPLESCGQEDVGAGGVNRPARECLLDAYQSGRGAELVSTELTAEGDPVTRILRVYPDGRVEVLVDGTRDRFGSGEWERLRCDDLIPIAHMRGGQPPIERVFLEDDCVAVPIP